MKVVAEGVEEQAQFDLLCDFDVDEIQGYLLSKPVEAEAFGKLIVLPEQKLQAPIKVARVGAS